jgi:ABC-type sugar transport system ATPase subunit
MTPTQTALVSLKGISKTFGAIRALDDVSLDLYYRDLVGLVGDNGAGKSTLVKILSAPTSPRMARSSSRVARSHSRLPPKPNDSESRLSIRTCR